MSSERPGENTRINRIAHYIDDLDRCPANKVVDVLQAIHLLLAFPLFVVVVGVDARWITRSLQTHYLRLLHSTTEQEQGFSNLIGKATPHDYLEKIFQLPFWLQPMVEKACKDMVQGLLALQVEPRRGPETDGLGTTDADSPHPTAPLASTRFRDRNSSRNGHSFKTRNNSWPGTNARGAQRGCARQRRRAGGIRRSSAPRGNPRDPA